MDVHPAVFNTAANKAPHCRAGNCSLLGGSLAGRGLGETDTRTYTPESLPCSPEAITALLISCTLFYFHTR